MRTFCWLFLVGVLAHCREPRPAAKPPGDRINGLSLVAPIRQVDSSILGPVRAVGANWVALMPYAFGEMGQPTLHHANSRQWWGERPDGVAAMIQMAHRQGLKVMVKPQIWLRGGEYTGKLTMKSGADWQSWEESYREFILGYARLADSAKAELLCIGTELDGSVAGRPQFWKALIGEIRSVYNGKLTYAANWDTHQVFPHWTLLDYVGVDAYFPLTNDASPSVEDLESAWQPHVKALRNFSNKLSRPILFTEFGYRSVSNCAHKPWVSDTDDPADAQAQRNAYEALFRACWAQPWMVGGFVWKWYEKPIREGRWHRHATDYTPQQKPAEKVLKAWYGGTPETSGSPL
ncbi:MAG: hypothetical protein LH606_10995 [Cytophagaceae bacterium]|nr:hypothetical protein [Cytophagaceae bacterium]